MASLLLAVIYVAFISLGLPDGLLGAAWPTMGPDLGAPLSWQGGISAVISLGTITSALLSDRLTLKLGAGKVTAISVGMTAAALFGFSVAPNYWVLILMAIPYGLGAGGVDAALNNYVAIHYESRHMSWLHCMWGIGASVGPYIMGFALSNGQGWPSGYRYVSVIQVVLTALILLTLPLWKSRNQAGNASAQSTGYSAEKSAEQASQEAKPLGLRGVVAIKGAKEILIMFLCYCAIESTAGLWASSYMVIHGGMDRASAATWASLFYTGITVGRALSGFMTMKFNDPTMIRIGLAVLFVGIAVMVLPVPGNGAIMAGLVLIGLGCAPIYPCVIHSTPAYFGADKSQAIIGVQMASAYVGSLAAPPIFGVIAEYVTIDSFPVYMLAFLLLMVFMHEQLRRKRPVEM
ncbi:MFS transporter [Bifidobacterium tsurumiense]|uniref:Transporter, major facilitator family protein n=1 Tax=Bifidobacterium tsurumiense TaxID=356829 RepID=A0A087EIA2_9BIFI|nr:MFS transporter [Bifidobacterium tsurumiense]KFJ07503.1 transporter, major facilitator family protein [Bifidobacterium tsurumiense]